MLRKLIPIVAAIFAFTAYSQPQQDEAQPETQEEAQQVEQEEKDQPKIVTLSRNNTVFLNDYVYGESTANLLKKAHDMDSKLMPGAPIFLVIDSGGGSIQYGLEMINTLASFDRPVHTISIWSASMAFHTVQGLGKRYLVRDGTLMSHKARGFFYGEFPGQLDSRYNYYLRRVERMNERVVERTDGQYSLEEYRALIENEYWCDGTDCVSDGFADEIVRAQCDASLSGIRKERFGRLLIPKKDAEGPLDFYVVEFVDVYSRCPLITGYLDWNIYIDGDPVFSLDPNGNLEENLNTIDTGNALLDAKIKDLVKKRHKRFEKHKGHEVIFEL